MSTLTGTGSLVRLALRLDRIKLPVWIVALAVLTVSTTSAFEELYSTVAEREAFAATINANPALSALPGGAIHRLSFVGPPSAAFDVARFKHRVTAALPGAIVV